VLRDVAREALLNIEKHAKASSVVVTLGGDDDGVAMVVTDDGVGLRQQPGPDRGIGLDCIVERLQRVGGTGMLTAGDDGGCMIRAWVPC
jgi:signal transduction histidine kinase